MWARKPNIKLAKFFFAKYRLNIDQVVVRGFLQAVGSDTNL